MKVLLGVTLVILAAGADRATAADHHDATTIALESAADRILIDRGSGRLLSLRSKTAPGVELITTAADHPAFVLDYFLGADRQYRSFDSRDAKKVSVHCADSGPQRTLTMVFARLGGLDLDVTLTARASKQERLSRWSIAAKNGAGLQVANVQFPFVVVPSDAKGSLLLPHDFGQLRTGALLEQQPQDNPWHWRGIFSHYPGAMFAQFLAWYTDRGGVYLACEDTAGNVKVLKAVKRAPGMRLGIAHVGDWPTRGERKLEYDVVLGSFAGDWHDAADLYRHWSLQQKWATPLKKRTDVPKWLLDSPVYITVRPQGYMDHESVKIKEFLPYDKCIPMLESIAKRVESPLSVVLMAWERGGPWVYPDCFPPVGGDESITNFCAMARQRGWNVGSFCNGTRWVTGRKDGYDGKAYYQEHHGEQTVCRHEDGGLDVEDWGWRMGYRSCMAQAETRRIAVAFVKRLIGWGMESIQFFDQNCNASTLPCFAANHGHPPVPGKWMAAAMADVIAAFRQAAADAGQQGVIHSTENPCNEFCLPLFQECDVRVSVGGTGLADFVPIFHYLFHECIVMQGMMSCGPEPYSVPIRTAWNGVLGEIPGAVMTGDGTLLNRETFNWAPWQPKIGNNEDALEMIRTVSAMRRGPGRDFLVYGRMQHPAAVSGVKTIEWESSGRKFAVPAVAHASWQTPDHRYGVVLANWTTENCSVVVAAPRLGKSATVHVCGRKLETSTVEPSQDGFHVTLPPLSCALVVGQN
jgi:hypothetical protein